MEPFLSPALAMVSLLMDEGRKWSKNIVVLNRHLKLKVTDRIKETNLLISKNMVISSSLEVNFQKVVNLKKVICSNVQELEHTISLMRMDSSVNKIDKFKANPRSPGTHIVGSWVIGSISLYRDPRTGTQYIGNWASRVSFAP